MRCIDCRLAGICRSLRAQSKNHFRWSIHNLVGHPLSELAFLVGLKRLSDWLHEVTIPAHEPGTGRG